MRKEETNGIGKERTVETLERDGDVSWGSEGQRDRRKRNVRDTHEEENQKKMEERLWKWLREKEDMIMQQNMKENGLK